MSGRLGNYLELVRQAQQKRVQITREQEKEIRSLYREIARSLEKELRRYNPDSLTYRWLKDYAKNLRQESKSLFQEIRSITAASIQEAAEAVTEAERRFYTKACPALSERFSDVFSTIPLEMVEELMSGGIYRDFAGLSERIWDYRRKYERDIQTILNKGILAQKPAFELAKNLERYLNPSAKKPWNWGNIYPGVNRVVDYNAQRLARTAVTHAYQLAFQRATKDNPFVEFYRWHSSNGGRVCELCRERDGQLYEKDRLPLDHPNGMCVVTGEISKSLKEIGEELGDWAAGRTLNPELDRWLNSEESRDIINLNRTINRRERNSGAFENLQIVMQKREVLRIARKYGLDMSGITVKIQRSESLLSLAISGSTDYFNIGRIDLFPNAFLNEESLIRTLIHEKTHVAQLKKYGVKYAQDNIAHMEKQAYRLENIFYLALKKRLKE